MNNSVAFPTVPVSSTSRPTESTSLISYAAHRATAVEVCDLVYGPAVPSWSAVERFYEPDATYENPVVTATSRSVIADIHALSSRLAQLDIPKPVALLHSLFGISRGAGLQDSWFKAMSMWNEVTDVSESESYDGHQTTILEHTLHIDILPGLLARRRSSAGPCHPLPSTTTDLSLSIPHPPLHRQPSYISRGQSTQAPPSSIFHLSLPIITRLSFNDAGKITRHRDFWDIKDLLNLLPGMSLAQWITTRMVAQGIRGLVSAGRTYGIVRGSSYSPKLRHMRNLAQFN
ncbi:uncharacterized protein B0H18DRAFT_1132762 [Fomitopsis serialis]|uniref:uncharacterized protein n=1 Tax=Fomitopsis serialis TaxID=139415 RepID=UPI0020089BD9|nr:uncharacterized protein B0H18DRAFT_1132762 [Neoantrodia serialis]KAH9938105.1 hypothetical protein B0H18DRAFT_1132762 [Neoantrodia serialis]